MQKSQDLVLQQCLIIFFDWYYVVYRDLVSKTNLRIQYTPTIYCEPKVIFSLHTIQYSWNFLSNLLTKKKALNKTKTLNKKKGVQVRQSMRYLYPNKSADLSK